MVVAIVPRCQGEPETSLVNGVELRRVLRRSTLPMTITELYEMRRAIRSAAQDRFDLILAHGDIAVVAALSVRPRLPIALVFHASGLREAQHRRSLGVTPIERLRSRGIEPFLYIYERLALRYASRILVLSDFSRRLVMDIEPRAASRLRVVGGGVDLDVFSPTADREALRRALGIGESEIVLMSARRLVNRMGIEMLLEAIRELRERREDLKLVIVGDGELRRSLEAQRDRLGMVDSAVFLGRVLDAQLIDWYRAADVFVLPTIAYEGFGMVTAEALACGTPVVGTDVGATSEILKPLDEDLLALGADSSSLAAAIDRVVERTTPEFRTRCHEYARAHLGWHAVICRWEQALLSAQST